MAHGQTGRTRLLPDLCRQGQGQGRHLRVNLELSALVAMLGGLAAEAKDSARIKFGPAADAAIAGIAHLLQHQTEALAVDEWDLSPEPQGALILAAVSRFCRVWCAWSEDCGPGSHERCDRCPLAPFTTEVVERLVDKIMEPDPE